MAAWKSKPDKLVLEFLVTADAEGKFEVTIEKPPMPHFIKDQKLYDEFFEILDDLAKKHPMQGGNKNTPLINAIVFCLVPATMFCGFGFMGLSLKLWLAQNMMELLTDSTAMGAMIISKVDDGLMTTRAALILTPLKGAGQGQFGQAFAGNVVVPTFL
jgi:hypothetical protein